MRPIPNSITVPLPSCVPNGAVLPLFWELGDSNKFGFPDCVIFDVTNILANKGKLGLPRI